MQRPPWATLATLPADPLLALIGAFASDARADKIDLGVGVYRDETGRTPILATVKAAEQRLVEIQQSKSYLGPEGDGGFIERLSRIALPREVRELDFAALQTPGGTGALYLALALVAQANAAARVYLPLPAWPNHLPMIMRAGLQPVAVELFDARRQKSEFDRLLTALADARPGDVLLMQAACHNPTGIDPDAAAWASLTEVVERHGLIPLIDHAYHGFGTMLDSDGTAALSLIARAGTGLLAYSCNKNFALYRDRVGALFAFGAQPLLPAVQSNLTMIARTCWSMPPDHGASVVRTILDDVDLTSAWRIEVDAMRERIAGLRRAIASAAPLLAYFTDQHGMFSLLPLTDPSQVMRLRTDHGIYVAPSGRINIAGLRSDDIGRFVDALIATRVIN